MLGNAGVGDDLLPGLPNPTNLARRANRARQKRRPKDPKDLQFELCNAFLPEGKLKIQLLKMLSLHTLQNQMLIFEHASE